MIIAILMCVRRAHKLCKAKGRSDEWIEKRVRGIAIRDGA